MSSLVMLAASVFLDIVRINKQTNTQTNDGQNLTPSTAVGVGNFDECVMTMLSLFHVIFMLFCIGSDELYEPKSK